MSPSPGWCKRTFTGPRPWENPNAAPFSEIPDCSRGEMRLAAEVALAELRGNAIPGAAFQRAVGILTVMALG
jgi:hypothetical protein